MNCTELILELQKLDPMAPVVFPDSENGYRNVDKANLALMATFSDKTFTYDDLFKFAAHVRQRLRTTQVVVIHDDA